MTLYFLQCHSSKIEYRYNLLKLFYQLNCSFPNPVNIRILRVSSGVEVVATLPRGFNYFCKLISI